ncbi:MAG TPA: hypothetical protein VN181_15790, partial [Thermoanaerobaculia bacterium]|nr:hypothetical protein [Thermoanaerobaculia bacterium]
CSSIYTQAGRYLDVLTVPDHGPPVERYIDIKPGGAKKIYEAEAEHCADLEYAFRTSLAKYRDAVNKLAKRKKTFASQAAAEKKITDIVHLDPSSWATRYDQLLLKTTIRDKRSWHSVTDLASQLGIKVKEKPNRTTGNRVAEDSLVIDKDSFPEVGVHRTADIIK